MSRLRSKYLTRSPAGGGSGGKQKKALFAELKGLTSATPGKSQGVGGEDAPEQVGNTSYE